MRLFFLLLVLAVVFLSGTVFGMKQENEKVDRTSELVEIKEEAVDQDIETEIVAETASSPALHPEMDSAQTMDSTLNIASVLEAGVKGFFELIMQIMYQTAQLFF